MIQLLLNGMIEEAIYNKDTSAAFATSNRVKQDCVLVLVLFKLFFILHVVMCFPALKEGV